MNIAMLGHKRIPSREGGIEVVVEELALRMAAQGHSVCCYNRGGDFHRKFRNEYRGVQLRRVPTINCKGLAAVSSSFFGALFSAFSDADVLHIHGEGSAFFCWLPRLFGKRVVVTVHGLDWAREKWQGTFASRYIRWGEEMAVRFAHEIIVLSRHTQNYFQETYGRATHVIPNGVEPVQRVKADEIRRRFSLEQDGYLLFLGRLVPEKGIHELIRAFRQVDTEKKLVIAGASSDSEDYVRRLKELAAGDERILFSGFAQGRVLQELYSNCWIYVLPSHLEGLPLTLLEAMSCGTCCLLSNLPECAEVAEDKALFFPKGDVPALRDMLQMLCREPALVEAFRAQSSDFITKKYNWDRVTEQTLELYR